MPGNGVAISSRVQEMQHEYYTGAAPLVGRDGTVATSPPRGRWFEVERDGQSLGYAVKPFADANNFTKELRRQMRRTNARLSAKAATTAGEETATVRLPALLQTINKDRIIKIHTVR